MEKLNFGDKLQILRKQKGLSQKEFAEYLSIPQPSLSAYENNKNSPTMEVLIGIARKCDVSLDWLCGLSNLKHTVSTLGDVAAFFYNLFETNEIYAHYEIEDRVDIETETERNYVKITFYAREQGYPRNGEICAVIGRVKNHFSDLETYNLSKEMYEMAKEKDVEYFTTPLTKKHFPELSHDELLKKRWEHMESLRK